MALIKLLWHTTNVHLRVLNDLIRYEETVFQKIIDQHFRYFNIFCFFSAKRKLLYDFNYLKNAASTFQLSVHWEKKQKDSSLCI